MEALPSASKITWSSPTSPRGHVGGARQCGWDLFDQEEARVRSSTSPRSTRVDRDGPERGATTRTRRPGRASSRTAERRAGCWSAAPRALPAEAPDEVGGGSRRLGRIDFYLHSRPTCGWIARMERRTCLARAGQAVYIPRSVSPGDRGRDADGAPAVEPKELGRGVDPEFVRQELASVLEGAQRFRPPPSPSQASRVVPRAAPRSGYAARGSGSSSAIATTRSPWPGCRSDRLLLAPLSGSRPASRLGEERDRRLGDVGEGGPSQSASASLSVETATSRGRRGAFCLGLGTSVSNCEGVEVERVDHGGRSRGRGAATSRHRACRLAEIGT